MGNPEVYVTSGEFFLRETKILATHDLVVNALKEIQVQHKDKPYHSLDHTILVMNRAVAFLDIVRSVQPDLVSDRDYDLVLIAGAFHDIIQDYDVVDGKRVRKAPHNEYVRAQRAAEAMRSAKTLDGLPAYSKGEIRLVVASIHDTVPAWDVENTTVYQPSLNSGSTLISRAIAYADIGTAALEGPEGIIRDADNLFFEDNIMLVEQIAKGNISDTEKLTVKGQILGWTYLQQDFIAGRKQRLNYELFGLPDDVQSVLREQYFIHFDESITAMEMLFEERSMMEFEELIGSMMG